MRNRQAVGLTSGRLPGALLTVLASVACGGTSPAYDGKAGADGDPPPPGRAFEATVERVVDGDTFIARRGGRDLRVRLIGIDAPESVQPDAPVECFGPQAGRVLTRLLPSGAKVRAAYQRGGRRDRFGRELWDVWLPGGAFVQARLVRGGVAEARGYPPQADHAGLLDRLEVRARAKRVGLWGEC